jgi:hypothetical protein
MLSLEVIVGAVACFTSISAALFGSGLMKRRSEHGAKVAVESYRQSQTEKKVEDLEQRHAKMDTQMALVQREIEGFNMHVRKLEMIPEINAKLTSLETLINFVKSQLVRSGHHSDE